MGVGTAAAFAALSLYQQDQARKQAKSDRRSVERQNAEQRKQDAWSNLIQVAGGGSPSGYRSESPLPSVPGYDFAGTLANAANIVSASQDRAASQATAKSQAERQARLDQQAATKDARDYGATLESNIDKDYDRTHTQAMDLQKMELDRQREERMGAESTRRMDLYKQKLNAPKAAPSAREQLDAIALKVANGTATPDEISAYERYRGMGSRSTSTGGGMDWATTPYPVTGSSGYTTPPIYGNR